MTEAERIHEVETYIKRWRRLKDKAADVEEEAAYYADALVGKFLQNRRKKGIHIDGVLTVLEPPKEDA